MPTTSGERTKHDEPNPYLIWTGKTSCFLSVNRTSVIIDTGSCIKSAVIILPFTKNSNLDRDLGRLKLSWRNSTSSTIFCKKLPGPEYATPCHVKDMGSLFESNCITGAISSIFKTFYVDHNEPHEVLAFYKKKGWILGQMDFFFLGFFSLSISSFSHTASAGPFTKNSDLIHTKKEVPPPSNCYFWWKATLCAKMMTAFFYARPWPFHSIWLQFQIPTSEWMCIFSWLGLSKVYRYKISCKSARRVLVSSLDNQPNLFDMKMANRTALGKSYQFRILWEWTQKIAHLEHCYLFCLKLCKLRQVPWTNCGLAAHY